jgi:thiamine-phosphate pyrophosphorylase, putative
MFKIICITDRKSCCEDYPTRLEKIAAAGPDRIILREKELIGADYAGFAEVSMKICRKYNIPCSIHSHTDIAETLGAEDIHLPIAVLRSFPNRIRQSFQTVGTSVHSIEEAAEAERLGADYVIAGHIFETQCKPGLAPRGLEFLKSVCEAVKIPVYAIGGIKPENIDTVLKSGASGVCVMSGFMSCCDPEAYINKLRKAVIE